MTERATLPAAVPASTRPLARARGVARRALILDTAVALFAEKGLMATTVRDISERTGILPGSLYHHFASKEEMIAEILGPVLTSQVDEFDRVLERTDDPTEILRQGIASAIAQTAASPQVARILHQDEHHIGAIPGLEEIVRQRRAMRARIEGVIEQGIEAGHFRSGVDPRIMSMAIFDLVLGAFRQLPPIGRSTPEVVTEQLTALLMDGLRA